MVLETVEEAARRLAADAINKGYKPEALHPYENVNGDLLFWRIRAKHPDGHKWIRPMRQNGGAFELGEPKFANGKPLYRLPDIAAALTNVPVIVVEGEKAADALKQRGVIATTSGSSASASKADWSPLMGRDVVIWPDNDEAGFRYAREVATQLKDVALSIKIIDVTHLGLEAHDDAADWIRAHPDATAEQVWQLPVRDVDLGHAADQWIDPPDPEPLPEELPPVEPFDLALLPKSLRAWVGDIAERLQCPPDYPAVGVMTTLAAIVGRQVGIRPKQKDDWLVVPNIYAAIVGRSGKGKTPSLKEPMKPLYQREIEAKGEYEAALKAYEAEELLATECKKAATKDIQAAIKNNRHQEARQVAQDAVQDNAEAPTRRRYVVNDSTVEKLGELLNENPNGLLLFRDELTGFLRSLDKDGAESARAFYLEAWNGDGRFTYDRIARGTIDIDHAIVSVLGGIQPGPLMAYLREALKGGHADDGLLQRFQLVVWPNAPVNYRYVDQWPNSDAKREAYAVFERLACIDAMAIGATVTGEGEIPFGGFGSEAQGLFVEFIEDLMGRLDAEHPALESHLVKYKSLVPTLALLIHLADVGKFPVGEEAMLMALAWAEYLESHARRLYAAITAAEVIAAKTLSRHISRGELKDPFTIRDIYHRKGWAGLSTKEEAQAAVELLVEFGYVRELKHSGTGRPTTRFQVNPKVKHRDIGAKGNDDG